MNVPSDQVIDDLLDQIKHLTLQNTVLRCTVSMFEEAERKRPKLPKKEEGTL